ncbi:unnamed protein product [Didymodactylos carnosus]|uniref:Uncharacterized protein n=1 Tax=Didymodactylos carnosus TaxID=1234261 RepID=A0A815BHB6_9BILA|nr:unnamed protein product [Didymodactylos carnosus]CAF1273620.1 unnamed protein product [Didymodactylos carnosus]CAF3980517.1 unnamed protein product [Didymodactylos carnosus]CAF4063553.1 unnamed protein product [Didymodactylos carnosus]
MTTEKDSNSTLFTHGTRTNYSSITDQQQETKHLSAWHVFKRHLPNLLLTLIMDILLPILFYFLLRLYIGSTYALLVAACPPLIMIIIKALWARTFDVIGFVVITELVISAIITAATHHPRIRILKRPCAAVVLFIAFIFTLIPIKTKQFRLKPIVFYFYVELLPVEKSQIRTEQPLEVDFIKDDATPIKSEKCISQVYDWIYDNCPNFRFCCYELTILWTIGFLLEASGSFAVYFSTLTFNEAILCIHSIVAVIGGLCALITLVLIVFERKETMKQISKNIENGYLFIRSVNNQTAQSLYTMMYGNFTAEWEDFNPLDCDITTVAFETSSTTTTTTATTTTTTTTTPTTTITETTELGKRII